MNGKNLSPVVQAMRRATAMLLEHGRPFMILAEDEDGNMHRSTSGSLPWVLGAIEITQDALNDTMERRRAADAEAQEEGEEDAWKKGRADDQEPV